MRFVTFVKRTDAPSLIRCLVATFEALGGLPRTVLTDRMKTVLLDMETGVPHWHPRFQELVAALGITPRVCKPCTPQTKGKVERSIHVVKEDFWPQDHPEGARPPRSDYPLPDISGQGFCGAVPAAASSLAGARPVGQERRSGRPCGHDLLYVFSLAPPD